MIVINHDTYMYMYNVMIIALQLELKFAHSHEALMLRKALQCVTSRGLFLSFLSVRGTSDTHPIADVEFWLEVQRYKVCVCVCVCVCV